MCPTIFQLFCQYEIHKFADFWVFSEICQFIHVISIIQRFQRSKTHFWKICVGGSCKNNFQKGKNFASETEIKASNLNKLFSISHQSQRERGTKIFICGKNNKGNRWTEKRKDKLKNSCAWVGVLQKYDFVGFFFFFMLFLPLWKLFIVFPMVSWFLATNNFLTTKHWTFVLDIFFLLNLFHGSLHTFHFKSMSNSSKVAQKVLQLKFLLQVSMFCWDSFENWTFSLKLRGADKKCERVLEVGKT